MAVRVGLSTKSDLKRLMRDLQKIDPELRKSLRRQLRTFAKKVAEDARRRAPRKSGALARSISPQVSSTGAAAIVAKAEHARINEFGGRHPLFGDREKWVAHKAQPYMFPAVQANRDEFFREADRALGETAKKAGFR